VPQAAAPVVPSPDLPVARDAIDLNTAGVEELTRLRGVGRGAAARIVAEREAGGEFAAVWDLTRVEGFDEARIRRFLDHTRV
jgi:competence protein ComEA